MISIVNVIPKQNDLFIISKKEKQIQNKFFFIAELRSFVQFDCEANDR